MVKKRYTVFYTLIFLVTSAIYAQSFSVGGSAEYNLTIDAPGVNFRGYYNIGKHICFGPEITLSFPKKVIENGLEEDIFIFETNLNAHYIFEIVEEKFSFYPLLGLNYTSERIEFTELETGISETETEDFFGVNVGAGIHIPFKNVQPFIEYHYIAGELDEHVISVGLLYMLGRRGEKEEH